MKIQIQQRTRSELTIGLIYAAIGAAGFLLAQLGETVLTFIPPCLFRLWSGIPCPSCGAARTGIALSHFHILDAFLENPLFFLLYSTLFLWGMNTLFGVVTGKNIKFSMAQKSKKLVPLLLVSAIILNWLYLVVRTILVQHT